MSKVTLTSKTGVNVEVDFDAISLSSLIKAIVEDTGMKEPITVSNISTEALVKIVEYCNHHKDNPPTEIPKPLKGPIQDYVSSFDANFIRVPLGEYFELIQAANYLEIRPLVDLIAASIASLMLGKTSDEIRERFGIVNDFTPEEEAQVSNENKWVEE